MFLSTFTCHTGVQDASRMLTVRSLTSPVSKMSLGRTLDFSIGCISMSNVKYLPFLSLILFRMLCSIVLSIAIANLYCLQSYQQGSIDSIFYKSFYNSPYYKLKESGFILKMIFDKLWYWYAITSHWHFFKTLHKGSFSIAITIKLNKKGK